MDENEKVVNTDSENKEGDHLEDDECVHNTNVAKQANGSHHGYQYRQHTNETNGDFHVNL